MVKQDVREFTMLVGGIVASWTAA